MRHQPDLVDGTDPVTDTGDGSAWRMRQYPLFMLSALGLAFLIVVSTGSGSSTVSGRVGGDFPAFYAAGSLVADGHIDDLYSPAQQAAEQADLFGTEGGYLNFAYPPHVALAYSPLSMLDYRLAYAIHTLVMFAALVAALRLLRPLVGVVDRFFALAVAASIGFYPMFTAVGGGQNTAVTLLLITWLWRSLADDQEKIAGIAVALLMFRPQYAIPLLGLLFLRRNYVAVTWAIVGASATWLIDALLLGPTWLSDWLSHAGSFVSVDAQMNATNAVSILGSFRAIAGHESTAAVFSGATLALLVAAVVARRWRSRSCDLDLLMALTSVGLLMMSPHAMFYDSGLVIVAVAVLVDRDERRWPLIAAVMVAALAQTASSSIGFSPFAPIIAALFLLSWWEVHTNQPAVAQVELAVH